MRNLVKEYIHIKGNGEAEEILEDYNMYVYKLGYVLLRSSVPKHRHNRSTRP